MTDKNFSVLDMASQMAAENNAELKDLFSKPEVPTQKAAETAPTPEEPKKKVPWTPDASITADMPELNANPVTYDKSEIVMEEDESLKNITDDKVQQAAIETMDELGRTTANIEAAKKRHGIVKFQIPPGQYHALITAAAGDTNYQRAQAGLDDIFEEIKKLYPGFILEWANGTKNNALSNGTDAPNFHENTGKIQEIPEGAQAPQTEEPASKSDVIELESDKPDLTVIVDKSQLKDIAWSQEEVEKIKKARTVNLNIVEAKNIDYSQIEEVEENAVDAVLSHYQRKTNDIVAAFPASKYRATITGLTYPEVIDLSTSVEMNGLDGEKKKWSICFNHIHNQSIGPWEEYQWYIDPKTNKKMKIPSGASIPAGIDPNKVSYVTKYDDFLQKTSFMDLEFILWKILCATTMDKEIISIDCHAVNENGVTCGKSYDWIYSPSDLLIMDNIDPAVLEDLEKTATASSKDEIEEVYKSSMLNTDNVVSLPTSGFKVVFGHISAYDYLTSIYSELKILEDSDKNDPTVASKGLSLTMLTCVKAFLIPQENDKCKMLKGVHNLKKVINIMNEIDWQTMSELVRIMTEPYQFTFALRDIVCPQCHNRSMIPIESMARLLFIVARSLASVTVTLKRT